MSWKSTLVLLVLVVAGAVGWLVAASLKPAVPPNATAAVLINELTPDKLARIEVGTGDHHLVLQRQGDDWVLPGNWPTRKREVDDLVGLICALRTRFAPIRLTGADGELKQFGLDPSQHPLALSVKTRGGKEFHLLLGQEADANNRFSWPTVLRLDDRPEIVRLAPGLLASLERPVDYYQTRRLFPSERVADKDASGKIEELSAGELSVQGAGSGYTLARKKDEWQIEAPVRDRPDPDKLKSILTTVPDLWAEQFVDRGKRDLAEFGLKDPEQTVQVKRPDGREVVLLVGKHSQTKTRTVMRPPPPGGPPGMPQEPREETIHEEYRYAKLKDNDQVFEIKADKLKDLSPALDVLRDARIARFRPEDVRRLEIGAGGSALVFSKDKGQWKLQKPLEGDAEVSPVTDLLDKLSNLQAHDKDVIDKGDAKSLRLDPPAATVHIQVEETKGEGDEKTTSTRTIALDVGKEDKAKSKAYVRLEGWPRISAVDNAFVPFLTRPALSYRSRRIEDFTSFDVARIEVRRGTEKYVLDQEKSNWRLASPVRADADATQAGQLAGDLGRLEAVEFVSSSPSAADLDKVYGLANPALGATITFTSADRPAQTIVVGKQRGDKPEYFAKVASSPFVFVVKKEIRDLLDKDSLAYRPLQIWQVAADGIAGLRWQQNGKEQRVKREGQSWRVVEPFDASAATEKVKPIVDELATLQAVRYEAHVAKELGKYGLDKPYARVALTVEPAKKEADKPAEKPGEKILLIGKPTAEGAKTRFAKLGDGEAVFVVPDKVSDAANQSALDFLDRHLLTLDSQAIVRLHSSGAGPELTLVRDKEGWRAESAVGKYPADPQIMSGVLAIWSNLTAQGFADYGPKADLAAFGLDKPSRTIAVTMRSAEVTSGKNPPGGSHTLTLGKTGVGRILSGRVPTEAGAVFARLDQGPGILVLAPSTVTELTRTPFDFVDHTLLNLDAGTIEGISRKPGAALPTGAGVGPGSVSPLEIVKANGAWQIKKPMAAAADAATLEELTKTLSGLRAARIAAYRARDLKAFGLDAPTATIILRTSAPGKTEAHTLQIGGFAATPGAEAGWYVLADHSNTVGVIGASLAERLLAAPLQFRDRNLAQLSNIDRVTVSAGPRTATFSKVEGTWKMTTPVEAEAEQIPLEDLINAVSQLRADQLVAENPADLKPYGLHPAARHWSFQSGGAKALELLIGGPEKGKERDKEPRHYAMLADRGLVFLLDSQTSLRALEEYRSRTVWLPLDAAQVDSLRYGYADNAFTLEKTDNVWRVAGKPAVSLKPEKVTETLDALSRLRALRYVVDAGADMKLYGLEPPYLTLDIQTPSGKRSLHIGRTEGDSHRYYAHVPEGSRSEVFVISEADASQIVRPLNAFLPSPPKSAADGGPPRKQGPSPKLRPSPSP